MDERSLQAPIPGGFVAFRGTPWDRQVLPKRVSPRHPAIDLVCWDSDLYPSVLHVIQKLGGHVQQAGIPVDPSTAWPASVRDLFDVLIDPSGADVRDAAQLVRIVRMELGVADPQDLSTSLLVAEEPDRAMRFIDESGMALSLTDPDITEVLGGSSAEVLRALTELAAHGYSARRGAA